MKLMMMDILIIEDVVEIMVGLKVFNCNFVGDNGCKLLVVFIMGEYGEKLGGIIVYMLGYYLSIELLWVLDILCYCGVGSKLMQVVEQEVIQCGCKFV